MRAMKLGFVTVASLAVLGGAAFCQSEEDVELNLFRPRLEVGGDSFPNRSFDTRSGEYGSDSAWLNVNIPLGSTHLRPGGRVLGYQFMAGARLSEASPDITILNGDHRLYTGGLNITSLTLGRSLKNLFVASLGTSFAEDDETRSDPSLRFSGLLLALHRVNERVVLGYGGVYTYSYGRALPLPLFGVLWKINRKWSLTALPPLAIVATCRAGEHVNLRIRTAPAGNRFRFSNENQSEFAGEPETVYLRIAQWQTTGEVEWRASDHVSLLARAGITRTTKLAFSGDAKGDDTFFEDETRAAPYARVAARFTFGKSLLEKWQEKAAAEPAAASSGSSGSAP